MTGSGSCLKKSLSALVSACTLSMVDRISKLPWVQRDRELERGLGGRKKRKYLVDLLLDHLHITVSPTYPVEAIGCYESGPAKDKSFFCRARASLAFEWLSQYSVTQTKAPQLCLSWAWNMLSNEHGICAKYRCTRGLGVLRAPTSSWRPFGPLHFVLRALRALRPCDPRKVDQHLLFNLCVYDAWYVIVWYMYPWSHMCHRLSIIGTCTIDKHHDTCTVDTCIMDTCIIDSYIIDLCIIDSFMRCWSTLRGSHGLSARRARRMKSRGPKGLQLENGARRAPRLLVVDNSIIQHLLGVPECKKATPDESFWFSLV